MANERYRKETPEEWRNRVRHELFLQWDEGVVVQNNMLNRVTKEVVARRAAQRLVSSLLPPTVTQIVDGCGGAAGNSIQFARAGYDVVYVERDQQNLEDAEINASIYGASSRITFVLHDMMDLDYAKYVPDPSIALLHVSPDWGGRSYKNSAEFDLTSTLPAVPELIRLYRVWGFYGLMLWLPRSTNEVQLRALGCSRIDVMWRETWVDGIYAYWLPRAED